ncbi:MAG: 50S ribosomal protein L21 [Caldisericia bacterium]|nr:50S ribosomal protein L21 [Caldisericia bacterium]
MFAIVEIGGKQYLVKENDSIKVEKIKGDIGSEILINNVLFVKKDGEFLVGNPYVKNVKVHCKITNQLREKKIKVFFYHAKTTHKRMLGHRQPKTMLKIEKIEIGG